LAPPIELRFCSPPAGASRVRWNPEEIAALAKMTPAQAIARLVRSKEPTQANYRRLDESGVHDPGLEPFPPSRPAVTDEAKKNGEALGIKVMPAGNRRLQPVVNEFLLLAPRERSRDQPRWPTGGPTGC